MGTAADKSQNSPVNAFTQGQDAPKRHMPNSHTCIERPTHPSEYRIYSLIFVKKKSPPQPIKRAISLPYEGPGSTSEVLLKLKWSSFILSMLLTTAQWSAQSAVHMKVLGLFPDAGPPLWISMLNLRIPV